MLDLHELNFGNQVQWIRIPPELDVPVTPRVKAVLDSAAMRRLSHISQLGLVRLVYPGATHTRLEHSLGVYRLAVNVLNHLARDPQFASTVDEDSAKIFLLAALVHDIGHWPYCHPLEDMRLDWIPRHEHLARQLICDDELGNIFRSQWSVEPEQVAAFLSPQKNHQIESAQPRILHSLLSGPIDVDKMDYLQRDSLHAGVPYGRNFDIGRLINSLTIGPDGVRVAISEKGKTAAEMMVFARYVMFSEVYWHHAVRSGTAMLQRAVFELSRAGAALADSEQLPDHWLYQTEAEFADTLLAATRGMPIESLVSGLFGNRRQLFKRLAQFNFAENPEAHAALARRPYQELVTCAERLAERLSCYSDIKLQPTDVLIDAPPVKLEVQFQIDVRMRSSPSNREPTFQPLDQLSPVVRSLATEQFDNFVKRVRIFVAPHVADSVRITNEQVVKLLRD